MVVSVGKYSHSITLPVTTIEWRDKEAFFRMKITLKELLEAGCHFGHQTVRWNPKMKPYIFAAREGVHVFDLAKTKEGLETAAAFVQATVAEGGLILFVGSKRQARQIISETCQKINMPYVTQRWLGGMITNWDQIKRSLDKMQRMKEEREKGDYKTFTKKEQLLIDRQILKFEKFLGGIVDLKTLPKAIFVVDAKKESAAVREASRKQIPVISMVDTNSNPDLVDYVIPVNDDAVSSIKLIVEKMGESVAEGLEMRKKLEVRSEKLEKEVGSKKE